MYPLCTILMPLFLYFCVSASRSTAGAIMFLGSFCTHALLLRRYLENYQTHFHQTYGNVAFFNRDQLFRSGRQKVKEVTESECKLQAELEAEAYVS